MITQLLKLFIVGFAALLSLFPSGGKEWADSCKAHEFERIAPALQAPGTVRVMSFNIRCADVNGVQVKDRIKIAVRQIKTVMPDTLGMQEATPEWMRALDKKLSLYDWVGIEREHGGSPLENGESCPIFYLKTKFKLLDSGNFWLSETPQEPSLGPGAACKRICTWAKLKNRLTGKTLIHVNTHFDHVSEQARAAGAEIVTRFLSESCEGEPVVFTADMNTTDTGTAYQTMTAPLKDARTSAKKARLFGTFHGCSPETHRDYFIDFILCSPESDVKTYRTVTKGVQGRFVSDHFPLYADLKLKTRDRAQ